MREEERVKVRLTKLHTASLCEQDVTSLDVSVDAVVAVQVNQPLRRAENRERNSQTTSSTTTIVMYCVMRSVFTMAWAGNRLDHLHV